MFFHMTLTRIQSELAVAKAAQDNASADRATLMRAAILQLRVFFDTCPAMESFQMTLLLKPEDTLEGDERVFKYRQHLKIVAPGCDALQSADDKASFFLTNMPFWLMGDGSFRLERADAAVQTLLACPADTDDELVAAYALALQMDHEFQKVRFDHYLGETH